MTTTNKHSHTNDCLDDEHVPICGGSPESFGAREESLDESIKRVELMASGSPTWDLSEKDCAALRTVLHLTRGDAMTILGITSIQDCSNCKQMWVNLNDRTCRLCGSALAYVSAENGKEAPTTN